MLLPLLQVYVSVCVCMSVCVCLCLYVCLSFCLCLCQRESLAFLNDGGVGPSLRGDQPSRRNPVSR